MNFLKSNPTFTAAIAKLREYAAEDVISAEDPRSLEVIADEIESEPYGAMRSRSLRLIAASQRAAIAKTEGQA